MAKASVWISKLASAYWLVAHPAAATEYSFQVLVASSKNSTVRVKVQPVSVSPTVDGPTVDAAVLPAASIV